MARSVDNNKAGASTARLFHYLYKLSASASPCFEWYPPASSFSKGFPGTACVNPEELFLFPGLHYSLNIKHVLCHYSQHVPGGQFGVVTISFWDYLWSSCQTAPFAKTKAWGGKLPQLLIGTSPSAKSLILSSCFTFLPFDFFHVHFCRMVSSLFWFCLDLNSSAFPQYLFYTISHLLARRYCMRRSSNCHGEGWACIYSHHKNSGQLLWHICGAGFSLGSSKPANFAMPGQCWGTRAPPSRLLLFKPSLAWFWPTPRSPGLRHSLPNLWHWPGTVPNWQFGCICSISGVEDFRSQDGASTTQLASWPERILEVLNFLVKM